MSSEDWEKIVPGLEVRVSEGCGKCVYPLGDSTWFCYVQHNCSLKHPDYGKLFMRDGGWRGALKAIVVNYAAEGAKPMLERREIKSLTVLRMSKSGNSVIVKANF